LINTNVHLSGRINALQLYFPQLRDIGVSESLFNCISYNRKTEDYRKAIDIARLILLNFHPDLISGKNYVLAIMFNMNLLWEKFVYISLKKHLPHLNIRSQQKKYFWKPDNGYPSSIIPDIVIKSDKSYVLDAKWKYMSRIDPSIEDLRQIYVYHHYFNAGKVALVYPGSWENADGRFYKIKADDIIKECRIMSLEVHNDVMRWQKYIADEINSWINC
jgi:5-methylcytosine-specific restriction enzyme subunit McrC